MSLKVPRPKSQESLTFNTNIMLDSSFEVINEKSRKNNNQPKLRVDLTEERAFDFADSQNKPLFTRAAKTSYVNC